jgi:hypothetical protein
MGSMSPTRSRAWNTVHPFGRPCRSSRPRIPILARQKCPYEHYIRDEVLGPFVMRVAMFFPFQATYYLNGYRVATGHPQPRSTPPTVEFLIYGTRLGAQPTGPHCSPARSLTVHAATLRRHLERHFRRF